MHCDYTYKLILGAINIYIYVSWKTEFYDRASYNNCCIDIPPEAHG